MVGLPEGVIYCAAHDWHGARTIRCPRCAAGESSPVAPVSRVPAPKVRRERRGDEAESALHAALGRVWWEAKPGGYPSEARFFPTLWIRQYPWGAYLSPPRRFASDAGFPVARVLVEVEGQVHSIKGKRKGDVIRRQLAEAAGWRVLSVLPEQVKSGQVIALVTAALGEKAGGA